MRKIRIRIAGMYFKDGQLLLVKHRKKNREYFLLPGGGQQPGESQIQALVREWKEELNLVPQVGEFLFCGESVPPRGLLKSQVLQLVYRVDDISGKLQLKPDGPLVDYTWMPLEKMKEISFFPACLDQIRICLEGREFPRYQRYQWLR